MSKTRVAAWFVGGALLLSSGVAFAAEPDPVLEDPIETITPDDGDEENDADLVVDNGAVSGAEEGAEAGAEESGEEGHEAGEHDNHGAVVSEAAHNHDFDEACGNHGKYVSEVARGGDPAAPECATVGDADGDASVAEHGEGAKASKVKAAKAAKGKAKG